MSATAKLLYGVLRYHQYDKATCWPGRSSLASALGCSVSAVSRATGQLEAAGFIEVKR
ncbi:MAG: helix-turn-helix domain-containing protein, partial [Planctomycetota bacterium]